MTESKNSRLVKILAIAIGIGIVLLIGVGLALKLPKHNNNEETTAASEYISAVPTTFITEPAKPSGPPSLCYIYPDSVIDIQAFGDGIAILTQNAVIYVNSSGQYAKNKFEYSYPTMIVRGDYIFIFDRNRNDYRIETPEKIIFEGKTEGSIITAAFSAEGSYAISTIQNSVCYLTSYNKKGEIKHFADYPKEYIIDIDITENGETLAVNKISSKNAVITSTLMLLDSETFTKNLERTFVDSIYHSLSSDSDTISAVSENDYISVSTDKLEASVLTTFGQKAAYAFISPDGSSYSSLCYKSTDSNGDEISVIEIFNKKAKLKDSFSTNKPIKSFYGDKNCMAVNYGKEVEIIDYNAKQKGTITTDSIVSFAVPSDGNIYLLMNNSLYVKSDSGDSEILVRS